jgi:hypothetical protein
MSPSIPGGVEHRESMGSSLTSKDVNPVRWTPERLVVRLYNTHAARQEDQFLRVGRMVNESKRDTTGSVYSRDELLVHEQIAKALLELGLGLKGVGGTHGGLVFGFVNLERPQKRS